MANPPFPKTLAYNQTCSGSDAPFARYSPLHYTVTLKLGFGVTEGHRKRHYSIEHIRLYIRLLYSKYASICYRFRDIAAYWSKIATPLYSAPHTHTDLLNMAARRLGVKPSDLRKKPWSRKTRMMGLSDSERILMICSAVWIQCTRVTDRRTDKRTDRQTDGIAVAYTRYSIYAVARKNGPSSHSQSFKITILGSVERRQWTK